MPSVLFGGGRNTVARPADISEQECADGENFDLRLGDSRFRPRKPFDLVATATNGAPIRGFMQLVRRDNSTSTLVQAGNTVYEWDLGSTFTSRATVSASSRLRGPRDHNFNLNNTLIITDLAKQTPVSVWDGSTFSTLAHDLGGDFYAKYCVVASERVFYADVTAGIEIPHMIVGSGLLDPTDLTVSDRPSSALSAADPFYLLSPDVRPINGLLSAFGLVVFSTRNGRLFNISGSSALDFSVEEFFSGSNASGDEAMVNIGNDVLIGRRSALDTLRSINTFADVQTDDVSRWIASEIEQLTRWTIAYESTRQRAFCFPAGKRFVHVLHKPLFDAGGVSPWSKWTTSHAFGFSPQAVATMLDQMGVQTVYMGDESGNIYRIDGTGSQDGGSSDITAFRNSSMVKGAEPVREITAWLDYQRPASDVTVNVTWKAGGATVADQAQQITLSAAEVGEVYGGAVYYGGAFYYGKETGRVYRQWLKPAGSGSLYEVKISITGSEAFILDEFAYEAKEG